MRTTTCFALLSTLLATACFGEVGGGRGKPGRTSKDTGCAKVEKDVTIRAASDLSALPKSGCYDVVGTLTLQGSSITSLVMLGELNAVDELELDHTGLSAIDAKRTISIYDRLTVTGNAKLTSLRQLRFEAAASGVLVDGNPALTTLDALLGTAGLTEVTGDLVVTGNAALTALPLTQLAKVTGGLTVSGNSQLRSIDVSKLTSIGHIDVADNPQLVTLTGLPATTINGDLAIRNNAALTSLGAMTQLGRVTGNVTIDGNAALANLAAFTTSLRYVDRGLTISNNANLTDLGALKHLQLVGSVAITNNRKLVVCRAIEIDRCVAHPTTAVITNNLDTNCNWQCD